MIDKIVKPMLKEAFVTKISTKFREPNNQIINTETGDPLYDLFCDQLFANKS